MYTEAVSWARDKVAKDIEMRLPSRAVHIFIFAWDLRTWFGLMGMTPLIIGVERLDEERTGVNVPFSITDVSKEKQKYVDIRLSQPLFCCNGEAGLHHRSLELIGIYPEKTRSSLNAFFLLCV